MRRSAGVCFWLRAARALPLCDPLKSPLPDWACGFYESATARLKPKTSSAAPGMRANGQPTHDDPSGSPQFSSKQKDTRLTRANGWTVPRRIHCLGRMDVGGHQFVPLSMPISGRRPGGDRRKTSQASPWASRNGRFSTDNRDQERGHATLACRRSP